MATTESTSTVYTDSTVPAADTMRTYRVRSITLGGVGVNYAEATATSDPATVPTAPLEPAGGHDPDHHVELHSDVGRARL